MNRKYLVVIEKADDGSYSAYVPDLSGCVSCGDTPEQVKALIQEAIRMYIDDVIADGQPIPEATTRYAELAVAI